MLTSQSKACTVLLALVLLALFANAAVSTVRAVQHTVGPGGGADLYAYWYYGHFTRDGENAFRAYVDDREPTGPFRYLDGATAETVPPVQQGHSAFPSNTPLMVMLLSPLAWFSWPTVEKLFLSLNLALFLLIPWLAIRLLPDGRSLPLPATLFIALAFYGLQGTPTAFSVGQTTLVVVAAMLGAVLLARRNWLLAGVLLGVALSKYSLALSGLLFLLYQRRWRTVAAAVGVQAIGLLAASLPGFESPLFVLRTHLLRGASMSVGYGIHLADLFGFGAAGTAAVGILLTVAVLAALVLWRGGRAGQNALVDLHVLTALALWSLLVMYHRPYDMALSVVFIALTVHVLWNPDALWLSASGRAALAAGLAVFVAVLSLPVGTVGALLPESLAGAWTAAAKGTITLALLGALGVSLWLLYRVRAEVSEVTSSVGDVRKIA